MFKNLLDLLIKKGAPLASFSIVSPDGSIKKTNGVNKDEFQVTIKTNDVFRAILTKGSLGIGEQFMLGNLEITGDFDKALIVLLLIANDDKNIAKQNLSFNLLNKLKHHLFSETKHKSLRDITAHYDISNDFYEKFLDPTMTYSCAYFKKENDTLEKAQLQKYEHICRKLILKPEEKLVDIGCGWGGMLIYAAQNYGVTGYGVTLSKNQYEYAVQKIKDLKLDKKIKIELKDYRDITGVFDKFVSIGMFEHVTPKYYPEFFSKIKEILVPGGIGVLHTIGFNAPNIVEVDPWYDTYIFPGGQLPSAKQMFEYCAIYKLFPQDFENLRLHYALTLKLWIDNYMEIYDETVEARGEKFARMWKWYLYFSRATLVANISQLFQLTFTNGINNDYPLTRENLYS